MNTENDSYNGGIMAGAGGRPAQREAPPFGRRLAAVRRSKGITQRELAELLSTTQKMVDYYERRATNPALDVVQSCAQALGVPVVALLGEEAAAVPRRKPGPLSQLERRFEAVKQLPRKRQQLILDFLDAMIGAEKT